MKTKEQKRLVKRYWKVIARAGTRLARKKAWRSKKNPSANFFMTATLMDNQMNYMKQLRDESDDNTVANNIQKAFASFTKNFERGVVYNCVNMKTGEYIPNER